MAVVDAYLNFKASVHICGRLMSESLRVAGQDEPEYVVGTLECVACEELQRHAAVRAKGEQRLRDEGINPDAWRIDQVYLRSEAEAKAREQGTNDD